MTDKREKERGFLKINDCLRPRQNNAYRVRRETARDLWIESLNETFFMLSNVGKFIIGMTSIHREMLLLPLYFDPVAEKQSNGGTTHSPSKGSTVEIQQPLTDTLCQIL